MPGIMQDFCCGADAPGTRKLGWRLIRWPQGRVLCRRLPKATPLVKSFYFPKGPKYPKPVYLGVYFGNRTDGYG